MLKIKAEPLNEKAQKIQVACSPDFSARLTKTMCEEKAMEHKEAARKLLAKLCRQSPRFLDPTKHITM